MITKTNKQTHNQKSIEKNKLRSNFKSLCALNQTVRLDYVPFQYYFCKFVWFNFKLFFSKQWMPVLKFMNFSKRNILAFSVLN